MIKYRIMRKDGEITGVEKMDAATGKAVELSMEEAAAYLIEKKALVYSSPMGVAAFKEGDPNAISAVYDLRTKKMFCGAHFRSEERKAGGRDKLILNKYVPCDVYIARRTGGRGYSVDEGAPVYLNVRMDGNNSSYQTLSAIVIDDNIPVSGILRTYKMDDGHITQVSTINVSRHIYHEMAKEAKKLTTRQQLAIYEKTTGRYYS